MKTKSKKKTKDAKIQELKRKILVKNYSVLNQLEPSDIIDFLISKENEELENISEAIDVEKEILKWTATAIVAKEDLRAFIKNAKRIEKQHLQILKQLKQLQINIEYADII